MSDIASFYKISELNKVKGEFELQNLGDLIYRGVDNATFDNYGNLQGGGSFSSAPTEEDYDLAFFRLLLGLKPIYRIDDCIEYHFNYYINLKGSDQILFQKHIEFVILPMLQRAARPECFQLVSIWITNNKKRMIQKYLQEKNEFLNKAYEAVAEYAPSSPFSVKLHPIEFGNSIGLDDNTTKRIVNELVDEGLATSGLGMKMLMITPQGLKYLQMLTSSQSVEKPSININVGNNTNFQYQHETINSAQTIETSTFDKQYYEKMVLEVRKEVKELARYLTENQIEDLVAEINYLESNLKKEQPKAGILKIVSTNIWDILKAIPSTVLANILTTYIQNP